MIRRSFLTGLGALFAAPAIVHAGNLMPVKSIAFSHTRYLLDYDISWDQHFLRINVSDKPLPVPPAHVRVLTEKQAMRMGASQWSRFLPSHPKPNEPYHLVLTRHVDFGTVIPTLG